MDSVVGLRRAHSNSAYTVSSAWLYLAHKVSHQAPFAEDV